MAKAKICAIKGCGKAVKSSALCFPHYKQARRRNDPILDKYRRGRQKKWLIEHTGYAGDNCLFWPFRRLVNGYATVVHDGRHQVASRVMCEMVNGPPPEKGYEAAHSCGHGTLGCVNPKHLRWATVLENRRDKVLHGTLIKGADHYLAKLTPKQAAQIVKMKGSVRQCVIAARFGVGGGVISRIMKGTHWTQRKRENNHMERL